MISNKTVSVNINIPIRTCYKVFPWVGFDLRASRLLVLLPVTVHIAKIGHHFIRRSFPFPPSSTKLLFPDFLHAQRFGVYRLPLLHVKPSWLLLPLLLLVSF